MAPKLGSGGRFKKLSAQLAAKGVDDPDGLAAVIGMKKLGKARFSALAAGRKKAKKE